MSDSERKQLQAEIIRFILSALNAAELPDSATARRLIRREVTRVYGVSDSTAQRLVKRAAAARDGQPLPEWGGARADAGRPRKATEASDSLQSSTPLE